MLIYTNVKKIGSDLILNFLEEIENVWRRALGLGLQLDSREE